MLQRLFILIFVLLSSQAHALSLPGFPAQAPAAPSEATPADDNSWDGKIARIRQKLERVQTLYETLGNDSSNSPRRYLYELQMSAYRQHLAALTGQKALEGLQKLQAPTQNVASGIIALNRQRQALQTDQITVQNLATILDTQSSLLAEQQDVLATSQAQLRRKNELLEKAKPENQSNALKEVQLAQLQVETRTAILQAMEERQNYTREQLQYHRERVEAAQLTLKDQAQQPPIAAQELEQVQTRIEAQRKRITEQINHLSEQKQQWLEQESELNAKRNALLQEKERGTKQQKPRSDEEIAAEMVNINRLEQLNYLRLENNSLNIGILLDVLNGYTIEHAFWQMYFNFSAQQDEQGLSELARNTAKWESQSASALSVTQEALTVAQMRLLQLQGQDEIATQERKIWQERADILQSAVAEMSRIRLLMQRWGEQFNPLKKDQTVQMRAEYWQVWALKQLNAFWHYELFSVADTLQVDGQVVTISRGVTVGKVVFAILLMLIGFIVLIKLSAWLERALIRRFQMQEVVVRIAKRWILSVAFIMLLINSLLLVRIPLTVFAFMGGAIAIGLGFGMQTLLKNLISGLMMILERPFKPGDTVEVGNLRGTVVDMSVRAAVIRDINGIETLVPNSTFLEQNVTNWTYSSSLVRQSVKVGVAYGSDVRLVAKLLGDEIERHGQICLEPKYEVLLEDFGADALMFGVYYWIDITAGTIGRQVASDLRFMIEASLRKNNITIAFPQRDVHVDIAQPVQLQLQREPKAR